MVSDALFITVHSFAHGKVIARLNEPHSKHMGCGSLAARSPEGEVHSSAGGGEEEGAREEAEAVCSSERCLLQSGTSAVMNARENRIGPFQMHVNLMQMLIV